MLLKLDSDNIFQEAGRGRLNESEQTEAKVVSPRRNWYDDFETVDCDVCAEMKETKMQEGANGR